MYDCAMCQATMLVSLHLIIKRSHCILLLELHFLRCSTLCVSLQEGAEG